VSKDDWGTEGDQTNREHVWAKSHGDFADIRPMDGDAHNLHAADASVNVIRSNYDFDSVPDGTFINEADAYYGGGAFEPADRDKGVIARTIFYMAVRYEGTDNELDLEVVDAINTSDKAEHGKLSTLLEWNRDYPPTEFERRRNERVFQSQLNRNPFIDYPEFADLIWANTELSETAIGNLTMSPTHPAAGETVSISVTVSGSATLPTAKLFWGKSYNSETYVADFSGTDILTTTMSLSDFSANEMVFCKVVTTSGETLHANFTIVPSVNLTEISAIQGSGNSSTMINQKVTIAGVVTANFDNAFYMQKSNEDSRSGICVYSTWRGQIGDGEVVEYQNLTEISNVSMVFNYGHKTIVSPKQVSVSELKEDFEGVLIKLTDVNFNDADVLIGPDGGSYFVNEGSSSIPVYVRYGSRLTGQRIPNGTVDITAVLSQYQDTYQLLIDNVDWIEQGIDITAPIISNVIATDVNYLEVSFNEKIKESTISTTAFSLNGVSITGAYYYPSTKVYLLVSGLQKKEYTLSVSGIEDLYGNVTSNATFTFVSDFESAISENKNPIFNIFPNPNKGEFSVKFNEAEQAGKLLQVIDVTGKVVYSENIDSQTFEQRISLKEHEAGYYLLRIKSNEKLTTRKLIIE